MGTKLDYAINILATVPNDRSVATNQLDVFELSQNKATKQRKLLQNPGIRDNRESMDRMLEHYNTESIKKTMLIHENIFNNQVRELHRLYRVQKELMRELRNEIEKTTVWNSETNASHFRNQTQIATQSTSGYSFHVQNARDDRNSSCSYSGDAIRIPIQCIDLEKPAIEEDISTCVSGTEEDQVDPQNSLKESGIELTLSVGGSISSTSSGKNVSKARKQCHGLELGGDRGDERGDMNRRRWFQGLSLI